MNDFQSIKDKWQTSLNKSLDNNVFSTWEWLSTWWKYFGKAKRLVILLVEEKNDVLAIVPFMLSKYKFLRCGTLRKISFVGSPESDYNTFILQKKEVKIIEAFFDYLNNYIDWNYLELECLPETSVSANLLRRISREKTYKKWDERVHWVCPYVSLPRSMNTFMKKQLGRKTRKNLRRYLRKLERRSCVKLKKYCEIGAVNEAMEIFFQLHKKRWELTGKPGAFNTLLLRDFHKDIAEQFDENGWLGLYFLTINDEPISATYNFEYNQKTYGYQSGFDPKYADYSVGTLTMMFLIEKCIQKGLTEVDLLRGAETYKSRWTSKARKNLKMTYAQSGLFSNTYDFVNKHNPFKKLQARYMERLLIT